MKTGAKTMTKGQIAKKLAEANGMKYTASSKLLASFVDIAAKEVKKSGLFSIQGLCRLKTRVKPATKAGVRTMFGKEVKVAAKPATTVVKAFPAAALKKQVI
jgi:nucleoid DNA-binding protein